uniref:ATP-dependent Clp protease proteolytic subunit n=1 Tax=Corydalis fangshanensis TaxID=2512265 RepID=UPI001D1228D8|nr:ATP-dependent Clp protease proteolytic subunit [Corydalis fangshanensis]QZZ81454.1 ATP-dependent Clp protease proteolytic subunit [Corydalis fangshanensis]
MPVGVPKVSLLIPEEEKEEPTWLDLYNRLHRERCLFLCNKLDFETTNTLMGLLVGLSKADPTRDFYIFIHCPGGWALCGIGLFDLMRYVPPDVHTITLGKAYSMGSLVLLGAATDECIAFPNGKILLHQPSCSYLGPGLGELYRDGDEFKSIRNHVTSIYSQKTKKPWHIVYLDLQRDYLMNPYEAKSYGLVDHVGIDGYERYGRIFPW